MRVEHGFDDERHLVVEAAGPVRDVRHVAVLVFAPPDLGDEFEDQHERRGPGYDHRSATEVVNKILVLLDGKLIGRFHGNTHDNEVKRPAPKKVVVLLLF